MVGDLTLMMASNATVASTEGTTIFDSFTYFWFMQIVIQIVEIYS